MSRLSLLIAAIVIAGLVAVGCTSAAPSAPAPTAAAAAKAESKPAAQPTAAKAEAQPTAAPAAAQAPAWQPTKSVTIVVHSDPGSGSDSLARAMAQIFDKEGLVKQSITVSNKPGGGSAIAQAYLGEQKGNEHMMGMFSNAWLGAAITTKDLKVSVKDLTPVVRLALEPSVAVVNAESPFKTMKDFLDTAKAKPNTLKQVGGSVTAVDNQFRFLMMKASGAQWDYVAMNSGGERIAALLGKRADLYIGQASEVTEHVRSGKLRIVATFTPARLKDLGDVPTLDEQGVKIPSLLQARAVMMPGGVSPASVSYWASAFEKLSKTAAYADYLKTQGLEPAFLAGAAVKPWMDELYQNTEQVMKDGGMIK